jgi:hypothetical protein
MPAVKTKPQQLNTKRLLEMTRESRPVLGWIASAVESAG